MIKISFDKSKNRDLLVKRKRVKQTKKGKKKKSIPALAKRRTKRRGIRGR